MDCCDVYADEFGRDSALISAQRYRDDGLESTARMMFEVLVARGIEGCRVLEFGGGVGELSLELVKAGATSAVNIELSSSYREAAAALAFEAELEDRVELMAGDALDLAGEVADIDVVVMNRVVCCYPDGNELMDVAIERGPKLLGVSFPAIHIGSRAVLGVENWLRSRRGSQFRAYVHGRSTFARPVAAGFREVYSRNRPIWNLRVWERTPGE